ncbi:unnamed protein product [Plutella xylostella]|uniref:(diamondback moth) hypothetical protein n=1 Tax=Plutella xylostella TaxID=51655 RepID=A0A8S4FW42_PLUXY|nr:unnamed protein product [Plutella xylostella]
MGLKSYSRSTSWTCLRFASLSEADLSELGVTAFGARRKMLLVIQELQKQGSGFKTSSAPGIDRKMTSPKYNTEALSEKDKW